MGSRVRSKPSKRGQRNAQGDGRGERIARRLEELGGKGPVVHLAHANGFPPGTYRGMVDELAPSFRVVALPFRPLWPGSRPGSITDWHVLAEDLADGLEASGLTGVWGVGHSLGGVCTMLAAIRRPHLFRAVVLIDPVILPPAFLWLWAAMRIFHQERRFFLVKGALRRRRRWPSRQECFAYLREKPLFARWSDRALWHYVEAATRFVEGAGGVELVYPPEWEAKIFATTPFDSWVFCRKLVTPALFVRGELSDTFRPESHQLVRELLPETSHEVVGAAGHLVPMERPEAVARAIARFFATH